MERVASRAAATGRSVPEKLVLESLDAVDKSVSILGPQADFVAEVLNEGSVPTLARVSVIDRSGAWAALKQRFARTLPAAHEFPTSLAPIGLVRLEAMDFKLEMRKAAVGSNACQAVLTAKPASGQPVAHEVIVDPECPLAFSDAVRARHDVPAQAATASRFRVSGTALKEVGGVSLTFGGFLYRDKRGVLVGVNALSPLRVERGVVESGAKSKFKERHLIDFGPHEEMTKLEAGEIPASRWDPILKAHRQHAAGARKVAWVMGFERLGGRLLSTGGGFAYAMETPNGLEYLFFPLLCE